MKHCLSLASMLFLALLTAGCNDGNGRMTVSGTVQLDGKPLAAGSIFFRSADGQGNSAGGPVKDGQFNLPASHGMMPGKYAVSIQTFRKTGRKAPDPMLGARAERLPVQFREGDQFDAAVTAGGPNRFEFTLNSK